jgi:hypothetical protein
LRRPRDGVVKERKVGQDSITMSFIRRIGQRIAEAGGPGAAFRHLWRVKKVPGGVLVGTDEFGNKYYEDPTAVYGE